MRGTLGSTGDLTAASTTEGADQKADSTASNAGMMGPPSAESTMSLNGHQVCFFFHFKY